MWEKLIGLIKTVFTISKDLTENRAEIKELRQDVTKLAHLLQHFANQVEMIRKSEADEREKLRLQLENDLLKFKLSLSEDKSKASETRKALPPKPKKASKKRSTE